MRKKLECVRSTRMPPPRTLAPPRGMTLGQRYHTLKGLYVGKCHTKFQLSSPEGIKVISCKRNADVNLHLNLQLNLNLVTNVTYAHTHVRTQHHGETLYAPLLPRQAGHKNRSVMFSGTGKCNLQVHRFSGKLGKHRFPLG